MGYWEKGVSWFNPPPKQDVVYKNYQDEYSKYSEFLNNCVKAEVEILGWSKEKFEKSGLVLCTNGSEMCYCVPKTNNVLFSFKL